MDIEEIMIRAVRGEAGEEELALLRRWRAASPENEAEYREASRVLREALHLRSIGAGGGSTPPSAATIIRLAEGREEDPPVAAMRRRRRSGWLAAAGAAAAALVALALGVTGAWRALLPDAPGVVAEARTGPGERHSIELPDGTLVHLDERTRLEATDVAGGLDIWLEGRAYLGVARAEGRVTAVRTPAGEVEVLGTRLNVSARPDELDVLVVDGRVAVRGARAEVEVGEGQRTVVREGEVEEAVAVEDPRAHLAWMERSMVFQNTPLDRAAREIEWRYGVEVELADPALRDRTITTSFEAQSLEAVVTIVCMAVQAECRIEGERVVVRLREDAREGGSGAPAGTPAWSVAMP